MGTMTTRVNGIVLTVTTGTDFVVEAGDPYEFDTMQTANVNGNYAKVVCLTETMKCVIERHAMFEGQYVDSDFPFEDTTEWVAIATANGFVK